VSPGSARFVLLVDAPDGGGTRCATVRAMRSGRLLALPVLVLALGACTEGTTTPDQGASTPAEMAAPTVPGRGGTELPTVADQQEALAAGGDATEAFAAPVDAGGTEVGQVPDVAAGSYLLRVVCTSSDGGPVTVTVAASGADLTSYQAPCVPVFQGGSTMADSDPFEVPGGVLDVGVTASADSVVAVGLVPAG